MLSLIFTIVIVVVVLGWTELDSAEGDYLRADTCHRLLLLLLVNQPRRLLRRLELRHASIKAQRLILLIVGLLVLRITALSFIDVHVAHFALPFYTSIEVSHFTSVTLPLVVILVRVLPLVCLLMFADT